MRSGGASHYRAAGELDFRVDLPDLDIDKDAMKDVYDGEISTAGGQHADSAMQSISNGMRRSGGLAVEWT